MNQRRNARFQTDQPIQITVFGQPDIQMPARVRNVSGRGVGLTVKSPLAVGAALKIVLEDAILLGEVIYCRHEGPANGQEDPANVYEGNENQGYYVGIELEQALSGLADLALALRSFTDESSCAKEPHAMHHAREQHE